MIDKTLEFFSEDTSMTSLDFSFLSGEVLFQAITVIILLLTAIIYLLGHIHNTRPILRFFLKGNPRGLRIQPVIQNVSNSDALACTLIALIVNGDKKFLPKTYNGKELFYIHARGEFYGNLNLWNLIPYELRSNYSENKLSIEMCIYYRRFIRPGNFVISELIFKVYRFIVRATGGWLRFNRIYCSPVSKWNFDFNRYTWAAEPNTIIAKRPPAINLAVLFQNPE